MRGSVREALLRVADRLEKEPSYLYNFWQSKVPERRYTGDPCCILAKLVDELPEESWRFRGFPVGFVAVHLLGRHEYTFYRQMHALEGHVGEPIPSDEEIRAKNVAQWQQSGEAAAKILRKFVEQEFVG